MSKLCMKRRESRRKQLCEKHKAKRSEYAAVINDPNASLEDKEKAQKGMQQMPRDASKIRQRNRCWITGRPHGVYRLVNMSRNMLRLHAMQGDIPGLHKASW